MLGKPKNLANKKGWQAKKFGKQKSLVYQKNLANKKVWYIKKLGKPNKLRFELGSTQAEAVRLQFYKKFKFS